MIRDLVKRASLVVLSVCLAASFTACGGAEEVSPDAPTVSMYDLRTAMLAADGGLPEMLSVSSADESAKESFLHLSDLEYDKVDGYFLSYAKDGSAYEIAVIAVKDPSDAPEAQRSLERHLDGRINLYKNYSPENLPLAEAAEVGSSGRYVYLIMCTDRDAVKSAMESIITAVDP